MATHLCFFKNAISCIIGILIPLLILDGYQGYGVLSFIITFLLVILSILVYVNKSSPLILPEFEPEIKSREVGQSNMDQLQEVDWPLQDNILRSPGCTDGSISDEESLIEITLHQEVDDLESKEPSLCLQEEWPNFDVEAIFRQHGLVELLAELNDVNEEDNLIEIDLSLGSIKCPRLELEA